jgi:hypothetical protein
LIEAFIVRSYQQDEKIGYEQTADNVEVAKGQVDDEEQLSMVCVRLDRSVLLVAVPVRVGLCRFAGTPGSIRF